MELQNKPKDFNKKQYIEISETLWGCVPIDVSWAMGTNIYKDKLKQMENREMDIKYEQFREETITKQYKAKIQREAKRVFVYLFLGHIITIPATIYATKNPTSVILYQSIWFAIYSLSCIAVYLSAGKLAKRKYKRED